MVNEWLRKASLGSTFAVLKPLGALAVDQELAVDPVKMREIDEDVIAAARELTRIADASGL
jgi:hypothetical protein